MNLQICPSNGCQLIEYVFVECFCPLNQIIPSEMLISSPLCPPSGGPGLIKNQPGRGALVRVRRVPGAPGSAP